MLPASAQTNWTWTGSVSSDWFNANNWSPAGVPASNDTVNVASGTVNLSAPVIFGGQFNWSGGTLTGNCLTITSNGVMNIEGSIQIEGMLTNEGTVNWQAGNVEVLNYLPYGFTGEIWNETNALWDIQCDQTLANYFSYLATFHNAGSLLKSAGSGTTSFNLYLDNSGTVEAQNGTIDFNGGSDLGGSFQADTSAAISFAGGSYTLSSAPDFQGPGPVQFTGGSVTLAGPLATFDINGASVSGLGEVSGTINFYSGEIADTNTVNAVLNWYGGELDPSAALTIATNGVLNIEGNIDVYGELTNEGTVNWQAGNIYVTYNPLAGPPAYTGEIWNETNALWDIQCDQTLANGTYNLATFHNAGSLLKSAGSGTTSFNLYLNNSGTVEAQNGTIDFNGGYSETSSANLSISLGGSTPGNGYGQIQFANPPTFLGSLTVGTRNGFLPNPGETFIVLNYPSSTGAFSCLSLDLGGGFLLQPRFSNTGLTLTTTTYTTSDSQPQLFILPSGTNVTLQWPLGFPGWVLQSATNLPSTNWTPVSVTCGNQAVVPIAAAQQYFRLKNGN